MLWLIFIGSISVLEVSDQPWLFWKIRQSARVLDIESWEDLHQSLVRYPWISSLHDEAGKALWDSVFPRL